MTETVHPASVVVADDGFDAEPDWRAGDVLGWGVPSVALESVRDVSGRATLHYGWVMRDDGHDGPGIELVRHLHATRTGRGIVATDPFLADAESLPHDADPRPLWPFRDAATGARVMLYTLFGTNRQAVKLPRANFGAVTEPLFGREDDLAELSELVSAHDVVLLKGPPGIGKTSLARHFAWQWAVEHAPGPAWFVSTPAEAGRDALATEAARAIGIVADLPTDPDDRLLHLGQVLANLAPNLLVLDGVDAATDPALELATQLTAVSPDTQILLTSQVAPPQTSAVVRDLGGLDEVAAVRLYLHRRRMRRPQVPVADRDLRAASRVARELVGTPAAIEVVSVALDDEPLPATDTSTPATSRAVQWAGERLAAGARALLRGLQVFEGPFGFEHVHAIADDTDVEAQFEALLDLSLVAVQAGEEPTFFLPSTVKRWARTALGEPTATTRTRWLAAWEARAAAFLREVDGPDEIDVVRRYRTFAAQAARALWRATEEGHPGADVLFGAAFHARLLPLHQLNDLFERAPRCDDPARLATFVLAGARAAYLSGQWNLALKRLEEAPTELEPALDAMIRVNAASIRAQSGEEDEARERADAVLDDLSDRPEPIRARALAHDVRARHFVRRGDLDAADDAAVQAVQEALRCEHPSTIAALRGTRALVALRAGRFETARKLYTEALPTFAELGRDQAVAVVLGNLAHVDLHLGHLNAAHNGFLQSIDLARRANRPNPEAISRLGLAWVELRRGDRAAAHDELTRASEELERLGNDHYAGIARAWLAVVLGLRGELDAAKASLAQAREHLDDAQNDTRAILELLDVTVGAIASDDYGPLLEAFQAFDVQGSSARAATAIVRTILDDVDQRPADLVVADDGRWFQVGEEEPVDITRRSAPRRVVAALARRHGRDPGDPMTLDELFEVGWPGEIATAEAAANRVYVTIATLRKLGLRDLLLSLGDGYGFDPDAVVRIQE